MNNKAHKQAFIRAEQAKKSLANCKLCPRNCGVDRTAGQKGYCGLDDTVRCFREVMHYGEESELVPSHQVYFTGCNLRCEYCAVSEWNHHPLAAKKMDFDEMAEIIALRQGQGAKTLNLLGGEPAVNLAGILELLGRLKPEIKVVWNSNMFYNDIVDELITGLVDIYLADIKCGNDSCAEKLLGARGYLEVVRKNILKAAGKADIIVRYLILPGHSQCCMKPVLEWLAAEIPDAKLSLRGNYVPPIPAGSAPAEYLNQDDMLAAVNLAEKMGLKLIK
jgi:putative pyruvate formate lyase activating enzyme